MSLSDLTKELKQMIILGALGSVIVAVLLYFGIQFSISSISVAKEELEDISHKIERADQSLENRDRTVVELAESIGRLKEYLERTPPERNYYSWATEIIYSMARESSIEVDAIDEVGSAARANNATAIELDSYSLRITAHGGYESIRNFLKRIEIEQPLVRFTGLDINKSQKPEVHDVLLNVEWPLSLGSISSVWDSIEQKQKAIGCYKSGTENLDLLEPRAEFAGEAIEGDPTPVVSEKDAALDVDAPMKSAANSINANSETMVEVMASTDSISENYFIGNADDFAKKELIQLSSLHRSIQGASNGIY